MPQALLKKSRVLPKGRFGPPTVQPSLRQLDCRRVRGCCECGLPQEIPAFPKCQSAEPIHVGGTLICLDRHGPNSTREVNSPQYLTGKLAPFYNKLGYVEMAREPFAGAHLVRPGVGCHSIAMSKTR